MFERHSPALQFPLQPSRFLHRLWWVWVFVSAGLLLAWGCLGAGFGLALGGRASLAAFLWVLCAGSAWYGLQRQPQGCLYWSGQAWTWEKQGFSQALDGAPVVVLDLQWLLVLHWRDHQGRALRFVLQRDWAPQAWGDMRRAVYSFVHPMQDANYRPER